MGAMIALWIFSSWSPVLAAKLLRLGLMLVFWKILEVVPTQVC